MGLSKPGCSYQVRLPAQQLLARRAKCMRGAFLGTERVSERRRESPCTCTETWARVPDSCSAFSCSIPASTQERMLCSRCASRLSGAPAAALRKRIRQGSRGCGRGEALQAFCTFGRQLVQPGRCLPLKVHLFQTCRTVKPCFGRVPLHARFLGGQNPEGPSTQ